MFYSYIVTYSTLIVNVLCRVWEKGSYIVTYSTLIVNVLCRVWKKGS